MKLLRLCLVLCTAFAGLAAACSPALAAAVPTVEPDAERFASLVGTVVLTLVAIPVGYLPVFIRNAVTKALAIDVVRKGLLDIAEAAVARYRNPDNADVVTVEGAIAHTAETALDRLGDSLKVLKISKTGVYELAADRINRLLFNRDEQ